MAAYDSEKTDSLIPGPSPRVGGGSAADANAPQRKAKARGSGKERLGWALLVALLALALLFVGLFARSKRDCAVPYVPSSAASSTVVIVHRIGDTVVNITVETRPYGPLANVAFINLHSNENTSVVAVRALQYYHGGSLTKFQHTPTDRMITFAMGAYNFTFDPNRMFTPVGIDATLRANGNWSAAAAEQVRQFAAATLQAYRFDQQQTVIGIHNNGPDYSADHYLPGGDMYNDSSAVYIAPGSNSHNFFFVTTTRLYDLISSLGLNVVLQSSTGDATDDGSLSFYCALQNVDYVNVEARAEAGGQGDQVIAQLDMFQRFTSAYFLGQ